MKLSQTIINCSWNYRLLKLKLLTNLNQNNFLCIKFLTKWERYIKAQRLKDVELYFFILLCAFVALAFVFSKIFFADANTFWSYFYKFIAPNVF